LSEFRIDLNARFEFSKEDLGMFRIDARIVIKILVSERGRVLVFVNCLECGYYMFFKPEIISIL
jgi:hypothetical protein